MENLQTNTSPITSAGDLYDLSLLEDLDGDEYLLEVLELLLVEAPKDMKDMKDAVKAGKTDVVCNKAHKIKSSAAIIQATTLTTLLEDIEAGGKSGSAGKELICMVENAADIFSNIEKALKIHVEKLKN